MRFKIPTDVAREAIALLISGADIASIGRTVGVSGNSLRRLRDHVRDWFAYEDSKIAKTLDALRNRIESFESQDGKHKHRQREVNRLRVQLSAKSTEVVKLKQQLEPAPQKSPDSPSFVRRARVEKPRSLTPQKLTRPENRSQCVSGGVNAQRPCPWVSCRYHLAVDVERKRVNQLGDPAAMGETCALDIAETGHHTLEEIGDIFGLTRERIRQIEVKTLLKLRLRYQEMEKELKDQ